MLGGREFDRKKKCTVTDLETYLAQTLFYDSRSSMMTMMNPFTFPELPQVNYEAIGSYEV